MDEVKHFPSVVSKRCKLVGGSGEPHLSDFDPRGNRPFSFLLCMEENSVKYDPQRIMSMPPPKTDNQSMKASQVVYNHRMEKRDRELVPIGVQRHTKLTFLCK